MTKYATLQSLLGLQLFLSEVTSLTTRPESRQCHTLHAVAKLVVLRQKALNKSVSSHLIYLRDVFAKIDPAFSGTEMQDAGEFLLRLVEGRVQTRGGLEPPPPPSGARVKT